tara:strand:+ start:734 stop:1036 length:303 start_codon:yes stop_codon:yes gene_type:complete
MLEQEKIAVFDEFVEEEASVLEIARALSRQSDGDTLEQLQDWIAAHSLAQAKAGTLGFYVDEFGAREVVACTVEEAQARFAEGEIWSLQSNIMLHVFQAD